MVHEINNLEKSRKCVFFNNCKQFIWTITMLHITKKLHGA